MQNQEEIGCRILTIVPKALHKFNSYSKICYNEVIQVVFPLHCVGIALCNTPLTNDQPLFQALSCDPRKNGCKEGGEGGQG